MPQIKPLSEFNRNQNALIEDLSHSGEPLYLTRNGSACVVVMDSAAFDAAMAFRNEIYEQEMRTYRGMLKGIQEMQEGKLHDAQDVMDELRALRGWECWPPKACAFSSRTLCARSSWRTFSVSGWRSPSIAKGTCSRSSRKWAASTTPSTMRRASRFRAGGSPFPTPPSPSIT